MEVRWTVPAARSRGFVAVHRCVWWGRQQKGGTENLRHMGWKQGIRSPSYLTKMVSKIIISSRVKTKCGGCLPQASLECPGRAQSPSKTDPGAQLCVQRPGLQASTHCMTPGQLLFIYRSNRTCRYTAIHFAKFT